MSKEAQEVYSLMLKKFLRTWQRYVEVQVPFHLREKRNEICRELKNNGLIAEFNILVNK